MAKLHQRRRSFDPYYIAWLDYWPKNLTTRNVRNFEPLLPAARKRAHELGYEIEVYNVTDDAIRPGRLRQILMSRSHWGCVIPPVPDWASQIALDMQGLTGVTIGTSLHGPAMNRVTQNHYQGLMLAYEQLRQAGCRRIGLALSAALNKRVENRWLAAYCGLQFLLPKREQITPFLFEQKRGGVRKEFSEWAHCECIDAILLSEPNVAAWAADERIVAPEHVAWLALEVDQCDVCGIDYSPARLGAAAIDLVIGQIHRNERGVPELPYTLLMDGEWVCR